MIISCEALLFDNDGVLVDSHEEVVTAWTRICEDYGLDFSVLITELIGARAVDTLSRHLAPEVLDEAVATLEGYEIELGAQTRPLTGAIELLASLPAERWCIVTSATTPLAHARLSGAGIRATANVVTADDVERGKPDPQPYTTGAAKLGVDPANCVVFEDSPAGGAAAVAAGARVIAVGDLDWTVEPIARVPDLSGVTAITTDNGLELTVTTR